MYQDYHINIMSGVYDEHFHMTNALYEFVVSRPNDFDKNEIFTIKKGIHRDLNGEQHFNFAYRGRSYHAYCWDIVTIVNGKPHMLRRKIYRLSVLELIY